MSKIMDQRSVSRRQFLHLTAATAAGLLGVPVLASCKSPGQPPAASLPSTEAPRAVVASHTPVPPTPTAEPSLDHSIYLLDDDFRVPREAGALNGTPAEPGPGGARIVNDSGDLVFIGPRQMMDMTGMSRSDVWNDPDVFWGPFAAAELGAAMFLLYLHGAYLFGPAILLSSTLRPADPTSAGLGVYQWTPGGTSFQLYTRSRGVQITDGNTRLRSIVYQYTVVRRPSGGAFHLLAGGIYQDATLLWVDDDDDLGADLYVGISERYGMFRLDAVRATRFSALPGPYTGRWGTAVSVDTFGRADSASLGSTEVGNQAWALVDAGGSIAGNALVLARNGGAIVNPGQQPRIVDVDVTAPAVGDVSVRLYFRAPASGAFDSLLSFVVEKTACYLFVDGVVVQALGTGIPNGATVRLRVIDWGDRVRCYVADGLVLEYETSAHPDQVCCGVYRREIDGGSTFKNWRCYPAAAIPADLGGLRPPVAGSGAVLFADDLAGGDGDSLMVHNADWTMGWGATWEIRSNGAQMTAAAVQGAALVDVGTADHEVEADITTPAVGADGVIDWFCGLLARWADTTHYIGARLIHGSDREIEVWEVNPGYTKLITMVKLGEGNLEAGTTYNLRLAVKGQEVCVYLNDELVGQARTMLLEGTKAGMGVDGAGSLIGQPAWRSFQVRAT